MADDALELAILQSFLRDTDFSYLEDIKCEALPINILGRSEADCMLQMHGFYRAIRQEFPNLQFHKNTLDAIWYENFGGQSHLTTPLMSANEWSRGGWIEGLPETLAAAFLGQQGNLEAVIVACVMLSHGYDYFGGEGRPLIDGYRYLLPAVASYASASMDVSFETLDIPPGWFDIQGIGPNMIKPNPLTRVLNPKSSAEQRRLWVSPDPPTIYDSIISDRAWLFDLGIVGSLLNMDMSFLSDKERAEIEQENSSFLEALLDTDNFAEDELPIDQYFTAYLVATHIDQLMDDAINYPISDVDFGEALSTRHPWLKEWAHESWRYPNCWPAGPFRDAINAADAQGTPGRFEFDREHPLD